MRDKFIENIPFFIILGAFILLVCSLIELTRCHVCGRYCSDFDDPEGAVHSKCYLEYWDFNKRVKGDK